MKLIGLLSSAILLPLTLSAATLFTSGSPVSNPGAGPSGSDLSVLVPPMTTLGFSARQVDTTRLADDFSIAGSAWDVSSIVVYSYQTGGNAASTTITGATLRIWNGAPGAGGSVIWGDTTTNVLSASTWSGAYRVTSTTLTNTTRAIYQNTLTVGTTLSPGTYWLDYDLTGSLSSGPFTPPITLTGQQTTGDARQFFSGSWNPIIDSGSSTAQGLAFIVNGDVVASAVPEPGTSLLLGAGLVLGIVARRRRA